MTSPLPPSERPLHGPARFGLFAAAALAISLFYLFAGVAIVLLAAWIAVLFVAAIAAARVGGLSLIGRFIRRESELLGLLAGSLWSRGGQTYRLQLTADDAPELFNTVDSLARRLEMPAPDALFLKMSAGAWVEMKGLRLGLGATRVGLGFDLLASLTVTEVEAVLAHELAHARLMPRAFHNWLRSGLNRAASLNGRLSALVNAYRRAASSHRPASAALYVSDALARWCARCFAACSRQHEFEADRLAAHLCGSAPLATSLQKLETVAPALARLPWNERIARIRSPHGLGAWLRGEITAALAAPPRASEPVFANRYSTHPSNRDRIAALPPARPSGGDLRAALELLPRADALALRLADEIEATLRRQEARDGRDTRRALRRLRRRAAKRPLQLAGIIVAIVGLIAALATLADHGLLVGGAVLLGSFGAGIVLYRFSRYRDRRVLVIPPYETIAGFEHPEEHAVVQTREKELEVSLKASLDEAAKKKRQLASAIDEAFAALATCDYLRAHVASRLAIGLNNRSVDAALSHAIATAAFGQSETCHNLLHFVVRQTGLSSPSTRWGAAWALLLDGSWQVAEGLLVELLAASPGHPTLTPLLAHCQAARGKIHSAVDLARRACEPAPPSPEHLKQLVRLLLDAGDLSAAEEALHRHGRNTENDPDFHYHRLRLHLLRDDFATARVWRDRLLETRPKPRTFIDLAFLHERARQDHDARDLFTRALAAGYFPVAHLGLARLDRTAGDTAGARTHLVAALDTEKNLAPKAAGPLALLPTIFSELWQLEPVGDRHRAWHARLPGWHPKASGANPGPLQGKLITIFAVDEAAASRYVVELMKALEPSRTDIDEVLLQLNLAPRDLQPDGPVHPGVQRVEAITGAR